MTEEREGLGLKWPARLFTESEDGEAGEFVGQMMTLSAKLAGTLNGLARDAPFTIATLTGILRAFTRRRLPCRMPLPDSAFPEKHAQDGTIRGAWQRSRDERSVLPSLSGLCSFSPSFDPALKCRAIAEALAVPVCVKQPNSQGSFP